MRGSRSSSRPTARPTCTDAHRRRDRGREPARPASPVPARGEGRSAASSRARDVERRPRVHGREQRVEARRACARSRATSPTTRSATSAGSSGSRARTARTWRASTGATRCGCASRSRRRARSPPGTARSTPCTRDAYVEDDPKFGHDFGFPYLMEQMGRRAVYEPEAVAVEKPAAEPEDEYGRKVRTISRALGHILTGRVFRPTRPLYMAQLVSHRVLRYSTGILHVGLLVSNLMLVTRARFYRVFLVLQLAGSGSRQRGRHVCPFRARDSPTTTTSSRRRRSRRSCATCAPARRRPGTRRRARDEPRRRRRDRRGRPRAHEPAPRSRGARRRSSRIAGRSSTARRASARTARTSRC